jgi:UDP-glucose 4-epimerase
VVLTSRHLRRVAVTGAHGLIGRHVIAKFEALGIDCVAIGRSEWDLRVWLSESELVELFGKCHAIVHVGARVPAASEPVALEELLHSNVRACTCIAQWAARRRKPVVFMSGAIVYSDIGAPRLRESEPLATTATYGGSYALSKILAEAEMNSFRDRGLDLCVLRPTSVYGAGMPAGRMVAAMLDSALRGKDVTISEPVDDRINLVHASDVARAVGQALLREAWDVFNIGGRSAYTVREVAEACIRAGKGGRLVVRNSALTRKPTLRFDVDDSKAAAALDHRPISLTAGIDLMKCEMLRGRS